MENSCPDCGKNWSESEVEFQVCNECGYENDVERTKQQLKRIGKSVMWGMGIIAAILFAYTAIFFTRRLASKSLGDGASALEVIGMSLFIILISIIIVYSIFSVI